MDFPQADTKCRSFWLVLLNTVSFLLLYVTIKDRISFFHCLRSSPSCMHTSSLSIHLSVDTPVIIHVSVTVNYTRGQFTLVNSLCTDRDLELRLSLSLSLRVSVATCVSMRECANTSVHMHLETRGQSWLPLLRCCPP